MPKYIALLRAVNVGGTGKLPMADLKAMCVDAGFAAVTTYIASGNVVLANPASAQKVKAALETKLRAYAGKPVGVIVRTPAQMQAVLKANPFRKAPPNLVLTIFLDDAPPADAITNVTGLKNEQLKIGTREIYVHYPDGQSRSKLKIPAAENGTARNMNTVAKLVDIAANLKSD